MVHIPKIDGDALKSLQLRITPLMRFMEMPGGGLIPSIALGRDATLGDLYRLEPDDGYQTFVSRKPLAPATGLKEIARTTILCTFQSNFLPSESEALAQLPPAFADIITAFEVLPDEENRLEHHGLQTYRRAIAIYYAPE
jgi:hypothetical protein